MFVSVGCLHFLCGQNKNLRPMQKRQVECQICRLFRARNFAFLLGNIHVNFCMKICTNTDFSKKVHRISDFLYHFYCSNILFIHEHMLRGAKTSHLQPRNPKTTPSPMTGKTSWLPLHWIQDSVDKPWCSACWNKRQVQGANAHACINCIDYV
jgi:hypothetical protein